MTAKNIARSGCSQDIQSGTSPEFAIVMATEKQKSAARKNVKKAATAARKKKTISHLPKKTRTALGKQGAKVAAKKR
jgi:hypothetical protein